MLKGASLAVDIFSNCVFIIYLHALPRTGALLFCGRGVVLSKESNVFHRIRSFAAMLALGGVLISAPVSAAEKPVDIPFMGCYVEEHPVVTSVWKVFFEEAEAKFAGKIAFSYYAENMLYSSQAESSQGIFDGRAAFGAIRPAMHPDEFRLLGVINIPGLASNAVIGSLVLSDLIDKFPVVREDLRGKTEHFTAWASAAYQLHTKDPVHTLKEVEGRNIVVWDAVSHAMVREMGATPVMVSPPDTYWTLQRGLADGIMCPLAPLKAYRLTGLVKHHLLLDAMVQGFIMEASHKYWKAMPKSMQKWFKAEGGSKMALAIGQTLEERAQAEIAVMETMGHKFCQLPASEEEAFQKVKETMTERWKEYCKGIDPKLSDEVLAFARARAEFHTREWNAGKYRD